MACFIPKYGLIVPGRQQYTGTGGSPFELWQPLSPTLFLTYWSLFRFDYQLYRCSLSKKNLKTLRKHDKSDHTKFFFLQQDLVPVLF
jgi:hypothetical protein